MFALGLSFSLQIILNSVCFYEMTKSTIFRHKKYKFYHIRYFRIRILQKDRNGTTILLLLLTVCCFTRQKLCKFNKKLAFSSRSNLWFAVSFRFQYVECWYERNIVENRVKFLFLIIVFCKVLSYALSFMASCPVVKYCKIQTTKIFRWRLCNYGLYINLQTHRTNLQTTILCR